MLTATLTFSGTNRIRYVTRILPSHPTLAEIMAWATALCGDDEILIEVSFSVGDAKVRQLPVELGQAPQRPLSHRLFH